MKKIFTKIIAGVMIVSFATAGLALPANATTAKKGNCDTTNLTLGNGAQCAKTDDQQSELFGETGIFTTIVNVLLFLIGVISVIMLIYGGIQYTLSSGDSGKVNNAKNTILYAIVGLIVAILSYAIVNFVLKSINGDA